MKVPASFLVAVYLLTPIRFPVDGKTANPSFLLGDRARLLAFDTEVHPLPTGPLVSNISRGDNRVRWRTALTLGDLGLRKFSLHLQFKSAPTQNSNWTLRFFNSSEDQKEDEITSDSPRARVGEAWTGPLNGRSFIAELIADSPPSGLTVVIDQYDEPKASEVAQGFPTGKDRTKSIREAPTDVQRLATAVARLYIKTRFGSGWCTGFLVSNDLLLTNYHCIQTNTEAVNATAEFGVGDFGVPKKCLRLVGLEYKNSDAAYDFVVARASGLPGKTYGHIRLTDTTRTSFNDVASPRSLVIVEHPDGGSKRASITGCSESVDSISGADLLMKTDFGHQCDTLTGSSGSPVFLRGSKELVGLHHAGFSAGSDKKSLINQAVYIGLVMQDIKTYRRPLFDEIVNAASR